MLESVGYGVQGTIPDDFGAGANMHALNLALAPLFIACYRA